MVMHLKSCCCGCSLKTGSVIIACLAAIYALAMLVVSILGASVGTGELQREVARELQKQGFNDPKFENAINELNNAQPSKTILAISICTAIVMAIYLIVSILLIFGASAERHRLVKPWIIYAVLHLIVYAVLAVVNIIALFVGGLVMNGVLSMVFVAFFVVLEVYFILVVNSFHTELLSTNFQNKI